MTFGHLYWQRAFRKDFTPQLRAVVDVLERRMIPAFDSIDQEAETAANTAWDRFMSAPGNGDEDPADYADAAMDAGVSHYQFLDGIRQGMVNLFSAALFHTFEQQMMFFLRRELLLPHEERKDKLLNRGSFGERLQQRGIEYTKLPSWEVVKEAEHVANVVKHGDGRSATELFKSRPDMFRHPSSTDFPPLTQKPRVNRPLLGEDVYVSPDDVRRYRDAMIVFWSELAEAMRLER